MKLTITIQTVQIAQSYIAATEVGGMTIRGRRADTEVLAIRNVLHQLAQAETDDAALGLDLAMEGKTIGSFMELGGGSSESASVDG